MTKHSDDIAKLNQVISFLSKSAKDEEKVSLPAFSVKLAQAQKSYPQDKTIGAIHDIVQRMIEKKATFATKGQIKDLYKKSYTVNTVFNELFGDYLNLEAFKPQLKIAEKLNPEPIQQAKPQDDLLANALNHIFDKSVPLRAYSERIEKEALNSVAISLDTWNIKPNSLSVEAGNEQFLIIKAEYETPKGRTGFFVPVQVLNNKVSKASVFVGSCGSFDLNNANIKAYLMSNAGVKLAFTAQNVLSTIVKSASSEVLSDTEIALMKLKASRDNSKSTDTNSIVGYGLYEKPKEDVPLRSSNEFAKYENPLTTQAGIAELAFGKDNVNSLRQSIANTLSFFGYKNPQMKIANAKENSLTFSVSLNGGEIGFNVPVKFANNKFLTPKLIISNGSPLPFTKESILDLNKDKRDIFAVASSSDLSLMKSSEVLDFLRKSADSKEFSKVQEALDVLNITDKKAYAFGLDYFRRVLAGEKTQEESKCCHQIKTANSKHIICSQTNLPIHKIYQDKYGSCRPLYRKNMEETYDGVMFMNTKLFG